MNDDLLQTRDHGGGIVELVLNRAPVNALSADNLMRFAQRLDAMSSDTGVRGVVLTSPFKVFSAGLDLKEAQGFDRAEELAIVTALNTAFPRLYGFPKPVVAAVKGAAIAGGLFYVLGSDYRVAGPRASFGLAEVRVGADFPAGPMEIARDALDPNTLRRLMLTGQPMNAAAAHACGLVDEIEEDEGALLDRALGAAARLAESPPGAYAAVKRQLRGPALGRIESQIALGANAPKGGWFTAETKSAMQRMIDGA